MMMRGTGMDLGPEKRQRWSRRLWLLGAIFLVIGLAQALIGYLTWDRGASYDVFILRALADVGMGIAFELLGIGLILMARVRVS